MATLENRQRRIRPSSRTILLCISVVVISYVASWKSRNDAKAFATSAATQFGPEIEWSPDTREIVITRVSMDEHFTVCYGMLTVDLHDSAGDVFRYRFFIEEGFGSGQSTLRQKLPEFPRAPVNLRVKVEDVLLDSRPDPDAWFGRAARDLFSHLADRPIPNQFGEWVKGTDDKTLFWWLQKEGVIEKGVSAVTSKSFVMASEQ